jgi:pyruvate/2-oxoglutarate dehydrogenase complex dihydrolipoamide dehydrogenase (E3) component
MGPSCRARATAPLQVEVKSETGTQTLETKNVIIATGSEARMLPGLQPDAKAS